MKHIKKIKLDIDKKSLETVSSVQYDSNTRFLHISLVNNSLPLDLTGCSVKIAAIKPDDTVIFNNCTIVDAKQGFVEAELTEQINAAQGNVKCELKIYSESGVLTTKTFDIEVTTPIISKAIISSNEFKALTNALKIVQGIDNKADKEKVEEKFGEVYEQLDNCAKKEDVAKISSGTPLFVDAVENMIDITKNYVNTVDGYLYIYHDGSFVNSGVKYQEMGLSDGQVTKKKTSFYKKSMNLENKELQINGKGILTTTGELYDNPDLTSTETFISIDCEYLSLEKFDNDSVSNGTNELIGIAFYNNDVFLKYVDLYVNNYMLVPDNATKIRYTIMSNLKGCDFNLCPTKELQNKYIEQYEFEENKKIYEIIEDIKNSIDNNNVKHYKNKSYLFMGDSITRLDMTESGWVKYFAEIMKPSKMVNISVNGATWKDYSDTPRYDGNPTPNNHLNVIGNQVQKVINQKHGGNEDFADFDVILIGAGTNDNFDRHKETTETVEDEFITSYATGNYTVKPINEVDRKTFAGAMRYAYEKLYELYPNAVFFVTTPLQEAYENYLDIKAKGDLIDYVADRLSITTINSRRCGILNTYESPVDGINYDNPTGSESARKRDLSDGIHTNPSGARKLGEFNAREIIKYFCF